MIRWSSITEENVVRLDKAIVLWLACLLVSVPVGAITPQDDPHYSPAGFFDIHICNWTSEGHFVMALFSTERFQDIERVTVLTPDGGVLGNLDLSQFRAFKSSTGKDKRAFIEHFRMPEHPVDGWYKSIILLKDGSHDEASDYVVHRFMNLASGMIPSPGAENIALPRELRWDPMPGARFYQVYIRDKWNDQLLHESKLLQEPVYTLPVGLLQAGGYYGWTIHARDVNEHILLGDFNHGTTSGEYTFTVR